MRSDGTAAASSMPDTVLAEMRKCHQVTAACHVALTERKACLAVELLLTSLHQR